MPDTVRLVATDVEWAEFLVWSAQPKPMMLDRYGRYPDVPHDLADNLFARLIKRLSEGELVGFGRWGEEPSFQEIGPMHWATMYYNIWFNELGYAEGGRVGFSSICIEQRTVQKIPPELPQVRSAVRRVMSNWLKANPVSLITKKDMLERVRAELGLEYHVSETFSTASGKLNFLSKTSTGTARQSE
ncbi:hypothetical protein E3U23_02665 [Erythrobacter litoralis]|uniref:hypothetical protein n=1 Tax=Erythrobacter litoralis TaxID=39960 RepID=UPI002434F59D|nr:hypothetical protein [Erythrobacter litoralis]MDG6078096.1 hypothetical protein [Erythrobacter litoralis]